MRSLKLTDGPELVFYTSIKELPIEVSKQFGAYMVQQAGIGSTMEDVDEHLGRITAFLNADKKDDAIEEAKNLRFNIFSMIAKWDYKSLAFGCLIKSVDGKQLEDRGIEGLNELIEQLSKAGLTNEMVSDVLEDVKKNLIPNGNSTFQSSLEKM